jgi:hypothetical protein
MERSLAALERACAIHRGGFTSPVEFERIKKGIVALVPTKQGYTGVIHNMNALCSPASVHSLAPAAHALGAHHTRSTCHITSKEAKTVQARKLRNEKRAGEVASVMVGNNDPRADVYMAAVLNCSTGRKIFPKTSASIANDPEMQRLAKNAEIMIGFIGKHHARMAIRLLTAGLPKKFLQQEVGLTDLQLNKRRVDKKIIQDPQAHSLCTMQYAPGVSRSKIHESENTLLVEFFKSSTAVFSGTERRCVEYTMHDWECKVKHTSRDRMQP